MKWIVFILFTVLSVACNTPIARQDITPITNDSAAATTPFSMFNTVDSLQILYYDNPYGDSLRYTRYFTFVSLSNPEVVEALTNNLKQPAEQLPAIKPCRSTGKIYCYAKGEVVKTVYFNTSNKQCPPFIYFINNGTFVYQSLNNNLQQLLNTSKQQAVAPGSKQAT